MADDFIYQNDGIIDDEILRHFHPDIAATLSKLPPFHFIIIHQLLSLLIYTKVKSFHHLCKD